MSSTHDMKKAEQTYGSFIGMVKWSVPLIALLVLVIVILIAS